MSDVVIDGGLIPMKTLASRLQKYSEHYRQSARDLPWWQWRRRAMLRGAWSALRIELGEIEALFAPEALGNEHD